MLFEDLLAHLPGLVQLRAWVAARDNEVRRLGDRRTDSAAEGFHKLLGKGVVRCKYSLKVDKASGRAIEKIQEAGGTVQTAGGGGDD